MTDATAARLSLTTNHCSWVQIPHLHNNGCAATVSSHSTNMAVLPVWTHIEVVEDHCIATALQQVAVDASKEVREAAIDTLHTATFAADLPVLQQWQGKRA